MPVIFFFREPVASFNELPSKASSTAHCGIELAQTHHWHIFRFDPEIALADMQFYRLWLEPQMSTSHLTSSFANSSWGLINK